MPSESVKMEDSSQELKSTEAMYAGNRTYSVYLLDPAAKMHLRSAVLEARVKVF